MLARFLEHFQAPVLAKFPSLNNSKISSKNTRTSSSESSNKHLSILQTLYCTVNHPSKRALQDSQYSFI